MELEIDTVMFKELTHEKETKWYQIFMHLLKQKKKQNNPEHNEVNTILLEK